MFDFKAKYKVDDYERNEKNQVLIINHSCESFT